MSDLKSIPASEGAKAAAQIIEEDGAVVLKAAANPDEAMAFAEYLTLDPEGSRLVSEQTSAVPVNAGTYEAYLGRLAEIAGDVGDAGAILTYEIQNTAVPRPRSRGYVRFEEIMNQAFSDIRNGSDVTDTLSATERRLTSTLSRL